MKNKKVRSITVKSCDWKGISDCFDIYYDPSPYPGYQGKEFLLDSLNISSSIYHPRTVDVRVRLRRKSESHSCFESRETTGFFFAISMTLGVKSVNVSHGKNYPGGSEFTTFNVPLQKQESETDGMIRCARLMFDSTTGGTEDKEVKGGLMSRFTYHMESLVTMGDGGWFTFEDYLRRRHNLPPRTWRVTTEN